MAFRAVSEIVLHVENFRNIDLFQQGLYFMRFTFYNEDKDKIYYANPYNFTSLDYESKIKKQANFHKLQPPRIEDDQAAFYTKTFFIRYAEEKVVLRDIINFRTEINVSPDYQNTEFYLRIDLFYAQPPQKNFSAAINSADIMKRECNSNETKFKLAQTKLFQINQLMTGISAYVPVAFDREYAAICNCTIHGSLIEYKFRIRHLGLDSDRKGNQTFMENGILVELKNED